MDYQELLQKTEDHINLFFRDHADERLFYHNLGHTRSVIEKSKQLANHYQLDDHNYFIVCAAACFHDTGQLLKNGEGHEERGALLAAEFLKQQEVCDEDIAAIRKCIMVTALPQEPTSLNEQIICDADLFNLGTEEFREQNKALKKEAEAVANTKIEGTVWRASTIHMMENHHYHTDYCRLLLNQKKGDNLSWLKNRQEEKLIKIQEAVLTGNEGIAADSEGNYKKKKKDRPDKGIETMFRISSSNNVRISSMADNKAHIMISVNSIIISVVLALIIKNLEENKFLLPASILLLTVNVATIVYAVLATMPKISDGVFTKEQVDNKTVNLLYFGSFYNMNFKEYNEGVKSMMNDGDFLYGSLTKHIFWQGKVLGRKYRLLRISYTIFLFGIVAAVVAFAASIIFLK